MTRIISFTGSQGTGKTTMRNLLVKKLEDAGYSVLSDYDGVKTSISRDAAEDGFALNEGTTFEAQYYMASRYISAELLTRKHAELCDIDFIVLDRSVLDVIPYTQVSMSIDVEGKSIISNMLLTHFNLYPVDLMIYCRPISELVSDGLRSVNKEFSYDIDEKFAKLVLDKRIKDCYPKNKLHILENDTLDNRMKIVEDLVEELI